jgi:hypothetical protein
MHRFAPAAERRHRLSGNRRHGSRVQDNMILQAGVAAAIVLLSVGGCTSHPRDKTSAESMCHRHFPNTTLAVEERVADVRFAGGPRPIHPEPGPLDAYPDNDRVVRCLVPLTRDSAQVIDIVVRVDKTFVRWTQGGPDATTRFTPPI